MRAAAAVVDELVVVIARTGEAPSRPGDVGRPIVTVRDTSDYAGPLAGFLGGAAQRDRHATARRRGRHAELRPAVLVRLLTWSSGDGACLVVDGEPQVLPLGLDRDAAVSAADRALAAGERSLRALVARLRLERIVEAEWRVLDPDGASLRDIDRPEDLAPRG